MYNEQEIIPILDKLGYDRVRDASTSFQPLESSQESWFGCFLARCYGEKGELQRDKHEQSFQELQLDTIEYVAPKLNITLQEAIYIMNAYDEYFPRFSETVSNWIKEHSPTKSESKVHEPSHR